MTNGNGERKHTPDLSLILLNYLVAAVYLGFIFAGFKTFSLWQQILDLQMMNPVEILRGLHPHSLRLFVMLPFLFIANTFELPMDLPFTVALAFFFVFIGWMGARILAVLGLKNIRRTAECFLWVFLPIAVLSLAMNGRIALAMFGITWIVYLQVLHVGREPGLSFLRTIGQVVGLLMASVSSGTLMVAFLIIVIGSLWTGLARWPKMDRRDLPPVITGFLGCGLVLPIVYVGLMKNINFYGGGLDGFVGMLKHGAGKVLPAEPGLAILAGIGFVVFGLAITRFVLARLVSREAAGPVYLAILLGTAGGAFGFSTIASVFPIFLVGGYLWVLERMKANQESGAEMATA